MFEELEAKGTAGREQLLWSTLARDGGEGMTSAPGDGPWVISIIYGEFGGDMGVITADS